MIALEDGPGRLRGGRRGRMGPKVVPMGCMGPKVWCPPNQAQAAAPSIMPRGCAPNMPLQTCPGFSPPIMPRLQPHPPPAFDRFAGRWLHRQGIGESGEKGRRERAAGGWDAPRCQPPAGISKAQAAKPKVKLQSTRSARLQAAKIARRRKGWGGGGHPPHTSARFPRCEAVAA